MTPAVPLLTVSDLRTSFHTRSGVYRAVDGVSFSVDRGETLGIVGESGSGKSVTCYSLMGLIPQPPGRIEGGSAVFDGVDLLRCTAAQARSLRGKRIAMIFQDPMTSLNPLMKIGKQISEPLMAHLGMDRASAWETAEKLLRDVRIPEAARRLIRIRAEEAQIAAADEQPARERILGVDAGDHGRLTDTKPRQGA